MLLIEYGLGILVKFIKLQPVKADLVIKNCSKSIVELLIVVMIHDEKELNKPLKELIGTLADKDSEKELIRVFNTLL